MIFKGRQHSQESWQSIQTKPKFTQLAKKQENRTYNEKKNHKNGLRHYRNVEINKHLNKNTIIK